MRYLCALFLVLVGCAPGTSTVTTPDADGSGDDVASTPDGSTPNNTGTDMTSPNNDPNDTGTPGDMSNPPDMPDEPDLPPMPSRIWTGESDGTIKWWTFDPMDGSLTEDGAIERGGTQNFLALSADKTKLFAVNQNRVEAFDISTLPPTFLGDADAGVSGNGTHLAVDATNSHVFVAWYGGNAVSMLPLGPDGTPSDATVVLGGDGDPNFCQRAHQIRVHPNNNFVYVPCLGSDHVVGLAYDSGAGTLTPNDSFGTPAGSGPRHMDFHPTLDQAYVIGELDDSITRFSVDGGSGDMTMLDTVPTRPNPGDPLGPASDVHVSPNGDWVVGINRNPRDEVVTFPLAADGSMGDPTFVSTGGEHARTFTFSPDGGYLLLGNSNSNDVTIFTFAATPSLIGTIDDFDARVMFIGHQ